MKFVSCKMFSFYHFLLLLITIVSQTNAQSIFCDQNKGNYTQNSTYHNNLKTLLSTLTSNTEIDYGFYNFSYGENRDKVYAIGLCRGDVNQTDCRNCLKNSAGNLTQNCPNQKEAIGWIDNCMLRYSNRSIFSLMETRPALYFGNGNKATNLERNREVLGSFLFNLRNLTASGDSRRKYGTSNAVGPDYFDQIYGVMQCTPDLDYETCDDCLAGAIEEVASCCAQGKIGGRLIYPSCNIRYESYRFYGAAAAVGEVPSPDSPPLPSQGMSNTLRTSIYIVVPVAVVVLMLCFVCICLRVKNMREITNNASKDDEIITNESLQFNFDMIRVATNDFSDSNKLGQGGFGPVYWGELSNGQVIAVKRLSMSSGQGDIEFKNEVLLVAKLHHRNLVKLLGFSIEGKERLLIYELVPNKSLDYFIFDPTKKEQLNWEKRYKIVRGIARGIIYLHEDSHLRIIHRDLKASNILLDEHMNPKISDFGMAKLIAVDQSRENTRRIVGTYGYMAPEYVLHGQFSVKSDVFSFGVLVLEIVSGEKNSSFRRGENAEDLLSFAWKSWREGATTNIIDPSLQNISGVEIMRCIHIGLLCVQENVANRPTMEAVAYMLNSNSLTLAIPSKPGFFVDSRTSSLQETQLRENNSVYEASITEAHPR